MNGQIIDITKALSDKASATRDQTLHDKDMIEAFVRDLCRSRGMCIHEALLNPDVFPTDVHQDIITLLYRWVCLLHSDPRSFRDFQKQ